MKKSIIKKGIVFLVSVTVLLVALIPVVYADEHIYPEDSNSFPRYPYVLNLGDLISNEHIKYFVFSPRGNNWSSSTTPLSASPYLVIVSAPVTVHSFDVSVHGTGTGSSFRWKASINSFDEGISSFSVDVVTINTTTGEVLDSRSVSAPILDTTNVFWLINNKMRGEMLYCCNPCGNALNIDTGSSGQYLPIADDVNYTTMLNKVLSQILSSQMQILISDQTLHDNLLIALDEDRQIWSNTFQQFWLRWEGFYLAPWFDTFSAYEVWWADHSQIIEDLLREISSVIDVENTVTPPDQISGQQNKLQSEDELLNNYNPDDFNSAFSFDPTSNPNVLGGLQFVGLQLENTFTAIPDIVIIITFSLTLGLVVLILGKKMR